MTTIEIKDASGKKAGTADLAASVFGIEPNVPVMHQVCLLYTSGWRRYAADGFEVFLRNGGLFATDSSPVWVSPAITVVKRCRYSRVRGV